MSHVYSVFKGQFYELLSSWINQLLFKLVLNEATVIMPLIITEHLSALSSIVNDHQHLNARWNRATRKNYFTTQSLKYLHIIAPKLLRLFGLRLHFVCTSISFPWLEELPNKKSVSWSMSKSCRGYSIPIILIRHNLTPHIIYVGAVTDNVTTLSLQIIWRI